MSNFTKEERLRTAILILFTCIVVYFWKLAALVIGGFSLLWVLWILTPYAGRSIRGRFTKR